MQIARLFAAAGLVVASLGVSATADAQRYGRDNYSNHDRDYRDHRDGGRGYDRNYRGYDCRYGHDRGRHVGWDRGRGRGHQRCWVEYRHHDRVTVCR